MKNSKTTKKESNPKKASGSSKSAKPNKVALSKGKKSKSNYDEEDEIDDSLMDDDFRGFDDLSTHVDDDDDDY